MKNETLKGVFVIWGPSKKNFTQKFDKQSKLGWGHQQKEFHPEIQQAKQAGVVQLENHATSVK
ncbi:hypothetical protein [Staphylococcus sp. GDY8P85P]|uniref:hypothetical protein n=1 Tax=Staphylococcus sp. GDY8P85P TaxID=2804138 RepID=UPI001AEBCB87|nr:hypothetical protein [Staphylococcus sp. GDY8P85P]